VIFTTWFIIIGVLFILMALASSILKRLPLTASLVYMAVGFGLAKFGGSLLELDPAQHAALLERLTEVAVLVSLFSAGLKLRVPLKEGRWKIPLRLASVSMLITIGLITLAGVFFLNLPLGAAILLGAILAPTDPVLASDVQVENPADRDRLRFGLTGEAGLNDGTATPFVLLGLGLLGLHEIGDFGWRWLVADVGWAILAGLGVGALAGSLVARLVIYLRREHQEAVGLDDFLALGLIAFSYGLAGLIGAYGFLAVFAAGLALRRVELAHTGEDPGEEIKAIAKIGKDEAVATDPAKAPAYMAHAVLGFNEQLERIGEVGVVLLLGGMLATVEWDFEVLWFVPLLFLVIRPLSVELGLLGSHTLPVQRRLMDWFGIRGIGSLYYLMFAIEHGLPHDLAPKITNLTLMVVASSIVLHGISVTPLMKFYGQHQQARNQSRQGEMHSNV
jgi:NhaP-type Na+/H+ or K+/H+ antiporter